MLFGTFRPYDTVVMNRYFAFRKNTAADVWLTYVAIHYCFEQLIGLSFANLYT